MRSRPSSSRGLFFLVLAAIAAVYLVGHLWLRRSRLPGPTVAGLVSTPEAVPPSEPSREPEGP